MIGTEFNYVHETIDNEGFYDAFHNYTDFRNINDPEFHRLRLEYLVASERLADYIGIKL
jgi:hypothetical protein